MVVYAEAAFIENFLIDGVLLCLALKCVRVKTVVWRLIAAAALGGAEALLFPLLVLPVWAAYAVKLLGGVLPVLVAVKEKRAKPYLLAIAVFFFLTFALGGLLTAAYSFFGVEFTEGNGYLVESAPVGMIFGGTAAFALAVAAFAKKFYRYRKTKKETLACRLRAGEREVDWRGYADSGNCLFFRGRPVCVTSAAAIFALFGGGVKEAGRMSVGTVNGRREAPVFEIDSMQIRTDRKVWRRENVLLTVGEVSPEYQLILNTALMEG